MNKDIWGTLEDEEYTTIEDAARLLCAKIQYSIQETNATKVDIENRFEGKDWVFTLNIIGVKK